MPRGGQIKYDLTGERFGKLVVIEFVKDEEDGLGKWRCICDCGKECLRRSHELTSGKTKSCGCARGGSRPLLEQKPELRPEPEKKLAFRRPQNNVHSLCFNCIRSAAPPSLQCIWDKSGAKELPEGAVVEIFNSSERIPVKKVISCPLYLSMNEPKNMKLLAAERKKNKESWNGEQLLNQHCARMIGSGEDW